MGGGGGGGGNMMKAMGRAVTRAGVAGLQDPISTTSASASNSPAPAASAASSSSSTCSRQAHKSAASGAGPGLHVSPNPVALPISWTTCAFGAPYGSPFDEYGRDWEWVSADGSSSCSSDEKGVIYGLADDFFALGPPPSADEVHTAVDELSQFVGSGRYTSLVHDRYGNEMMKVGMEDEIWWRPLPNLESDWKEPSHNLSRMSHSYGTDTVYRAFHLLQNDQSVQRMVTSISSDAAIWDAVMNNEVVRELRHAYYPEVVNSNMSQESTSDESGDKDGVGASENVVEWILDNAKARVVELMESIAELMNKLFAHRGGEEVHAGGIGERASMVFEGKVATSLLLSVLVLLVVVLSRAQKA
ncbi:unnamed protein product [Linum trigynum]